MSSNCGKSVERELGSFIKIGECLNWSVFEISCLYTSPSLECCHCRPWGCKLQRTSRIFAILLARRDWKIRVRPKSIAQPQINLNPQRNNERLGENGYSPQHTPGRSFSSHVPLSLAASCRIHTPEQFSSNIVLRIHRVPILPPFPRATNPTDRRQRHCSSCELHS